MPKPGVLAEPILVGREKELEELQSFLDSAVAGKGKTVFVSGEAGSGKSRLVREFLNIARLKGVGVMAGWCLSDAAAPYFPFVEAFNAYFGSFEQEETASLQRGAPVSLSDAAQIVSGELGAAAWLTGAKAAEKLGKPQVISPQVWKDQVFVGVAKALHEVCVQSPIVLFLEDVHWADSASLALLHYIARVVDNSERILVLATFRSEELTADAEGHPHPLAETLRAMRREDIFTEIRLPNLSQANISEIALNMLGGSLQLSLAEKLATESRGNPLFVVESLRMLHERRSLVQENNEWHLAMDELLIPSKIKDIILRRLAALKFSQRRVLDAASVIGEKFDVKLLSAVLGLQSLEVLETLNVIAHSTSLVSFEEDCYRFDHARSRETLYNELSPPLKRAYHGKIAEMLESIKSAAPLISDLAYHFAQAGNEDKAVKYALKAGSNDLEKFSNSQAINHFKYVLETIGQDQERSKERILALDGLAEAYVACSLFSEATKVYEQLSCIATGVLKLKALRKAASAAIFQGNVDLGARLVAEAEPYVELDRLEKARLLEVRAELCGVKGQLLPAMESGRQALQIFEEEHSIPDIAQCLYGQGFGNALNGQYEKGLANGLLSLALYDEIGDLRQQIRMHYMVGDTFGLCFLLEESIDLLEKGIEIEEKFKLGDFADLTRMYSALGVALVGKGAWKQGLSKYFKAVEFAEKTDSAFLRGFAYSRIVVSAIDHEDFKLGEKYYEKLMDLPSQALQSGWVALAQTKAYYYAAKGDKEMAMKCFNEHLDLVKSWRGPSGQSAAIVEVGTKVAYSKFLLLEGKDEEAASVLRDADKIRTDTQKRFEHVNLYASFMAPRQAAVGQVFDVRFDFVNVSRRSAFLANIQDVLPKEFQVAASQPEILRDGSSIHLKENKLEPFTVETIKLTLQTTKVGTFDLSPKVVYVDDLGQTKTSAPRPITITVKSAEPTFEALPGRVTTGSAELDRLLLGGIPENYAVILASPSSDERALLVKRFLEVGAGAGETTFYLTGEVGSGKAWAEKHQSNFCIVLCSPRADAITKNYSNVFKLKGVENLTEIDITLTRALRTLDSGVGGPKRACIEIISDVLLQHRAVVTRKWLIALLQDLKARGFTTLAVVDPKMHPPEETHAIISLFDGEIEISENASAKTLRVKKLANQRYVEDEIPITKEKPSAL